MTIAEGVQTRLSYKAYATGVITAGTKPTSSSDPGAASAQQLRRTETSLTFGKDTYSSAEVRTDRQIVDFRHGTERVSGSISGELSPGTYWDLFEAALRGTETAALSDSNTEFTSVSAVNSTSKFVFAGGDPVSEGYRVGMVIRFASLSVSANNATNFVILSFGGTSNRELTVFPAPSDMTADSAFTITSIGKNLIAPSSSHVSRKFAFELYAQDLDIARLFTECRVAGFTMQLPASGLSTIEFPVMGRDMEKYEGGSAPFFTSPTDATSTGIFAAVNGLIRVGGVAQGVVTGININLDMNPESNAVVGQNFVPEIHLGRTNVTGQMTAYFQDGTILGYFTEETEVEILLYLTTTTAVNSPAMVILMPRVKFGGADIGNAGEGPQEITLPFQALLYNGAAAGMPVTTIAIHDTEA